MKQQPWKPSTCSKLSGKFSIPSLIPVKDWKTKMNQSIGAVNTTLEPQTFRSACSKSSATVVSSMTQPHHLTESGEWKVSITDSRNLTQSLPTGIQTVVYNSTLRNKSRIMHIEHSQRSLRYRCIKSTSFEPSLAEDSVASLTHSRTRCVQPSSLERQDGLFESISLEKRSIGSIEADTQATSKSR